MGKIIVFTDGAVPNSQSKKLKKGGIGVYFGPHDQRNITQGITETSHNKVTNQVCELTACVLAIETIISTEKIGKSKIEIRTDSMYITNAMNEWASKWEKLNWKKSDGKPIQNETLIKKLYYLSLNLNVKFTHVKAHTKEPALDSTDYFDWFGNYMADKLATEAAK